MFRLFRSKFITAENSSENRLTHVNLEPNMLIYTPVQALPVKTILIQDAAEQLLAEQPIVEQPEEEQSLNTEMMRPCFGFLRDNMQLAKLYYLIGSVTQWKRLTCLDTLKQNVPFLNFLSVCFPLLESFNV